MRVAFLTAACMLPGHPERRVDHWEHDFEFDPMAAACAKRGITLATVVWDAPDFDPAAWDAVVIGTTWDYAARPAAFLDALARCEAAAPLFNPLRVVRWNIDKTYLRDLAARGAPIVPTIWAERADAASIEAAMDELGADRAVVKPVVGASAWRQALVRRGEPLPPAGELPPAAAMIQPFLPGAGEGEYSFLFFGGVFSHCARKIPADGDYRVQSMFGGTECAHDPSPEDLALAARVIEAVDEPLLYARVDMMRGADGRLLLMELELIEPYLYPEQGPGMGEAFAAALEASLAREIAARRGGGRDDRRERTPAPGPADRP